MTTGGTEPAGGQGAAWDPEPIQGPEPPWDAPAIWGAGTPAGLPVASSTHICQPGGGGGHEGSGLQPGGGVKPCGTGGQPGGGLKRDPMDTSCQFSSGPEA